MRTVASEVARGRWVHIFPEGRVNHTGQMGPLRWGVGKLVCDARLRGKRCVGRGRAAKRCSARGEACAACRAWRRQLPACSAMPASASLAFTCLPPRSDRRLLCTRHSFILLSPAPLVLPGTQSSCPFTTAAWGT